ncbi:hypothetical protein D3C80_1453890 [compost metagenome]
MGIDLRLQLLEPGLSNMDSLHVYILEQLLNLRHHQVESFEYKAELVLPLDLKPHGIISVLKLTECKYELPHRYLDLGIQHISSQTAHQQ